MSGKETLFVGLRYPAIASYLMVLMLSLAAVENIVMLMPRNIASFALNISNIINSMQFLN